MTTITTLTKTATPQPEHANATPTQPSERTNLIQFALEMVANGWNPNEVTAWLTNTLDNPTP